MFGFRKYKLHKFTDEELLSLYLNEKNNLIIGELYSRYGHLVIGVCMKYLKNVNDSEDMLMNIFEQLPKKIERHTILTFKPWLYTLTRNECLMFLRKKGIHTNELSENMTNEDDYEDFHLKEIKIDLLECEIQRLNTFQRNCIELFFIQEKSYQQIATILDVDINKVKSGIQNGKRNLKLKLESNHEFQ